MREDALLQGIVIGLGEDVGMSSANGPLAAIDPAVVDGVAVLRVTGEIDLSNSDVLRDTAVRLLDSDVGSLVLDLTRLTFFASAGIGALVHVHEHNAHGSGGPIHVAATGPVRRALELTAMDALFTLHDSCEQALAAARG
ncbi:STAS domain-containing protein [Saccharothrix sp. NPDC042600]|uniref:STAS domain-containing protein n=1 Tax=Saccharothrix TaxID=2071 RepID=UPI0033DE9427